MLTTGAFMSCSCPPGVAVDCRQLSANWWARIALKGLCRQACSWRMLMLPSGPQQAWRSQEVSTTCAPSCTRCAVCQQNARLQRRWNLGCPDPAHLHVVTAHHCTACIQPSRCVASAVHTKSPPAGQGLLVSGHT